VSITGQGTAATHIFTGLTSGVKYTVDVSATGTGGTSDWSSQASLTAD
jgi:hypothetical protein